MIIEIILLTITLSLLLTVGIINFLMKEDLRKIRKYNRDKYLN